MFSLLINALDRNIFDGEVELLVAPAIDGEITILRNHVPLITPLKAGRLLLRTHQSKVEEIPIKGGILEINPQKVIVLIGE